MIGVEYGALLIGNFQGEPCLIVLVAHALGYASLTGVMSQIPVLALFGGKLMSIVEHIYVHYDVVGIIVQHLAVGIASGIVDVLVLLHGNIL